MPALKNPSFSINLQGRDLAVLRGLFECRIMTPAHIASLYFDGKREYTKKRLRKLKAAGFIAERTRRVNEPSILFLTRKAFTTLTQEGQLSAFPQLGPNAFEARANVSELTVRHELEVMHVKAAFHGALATSDKFSLGQFSTWPVLNQFEVLRSAYGSNVLVKPDGFVRIHEREAATKGFAYDCFLEVDRSSETQETLVKRAGYYLDYYRSGGFAVRNGGTTNLFDKFPFRVLIVLQNAERRNNTAERLAQNNPPILRLTWLTTLPEVTSDPLGAIWILPKDYRKLTVGTRFDPEPNGPSGVYRRRPEREAFIESRIEKRKLLEESLIDQQDSANSSQQS